MSREKGQFYEQRACDFLVQNGFEIIERNFYSRFGEIDIVCKKDSVLHFVEVKGGETFNPVYALTPAKIKKVIQSVQYFLMLHRLDVDYCIDGISINGDKIEWFENIIF